MSYKDIYFIIGVKEFKMIKKLSIIAMSIMFSALLANTGKANNEMIIAHHHQNTGIIMTHHHRQNVDRIEKEAEECNKDCRHQECIKARKCSCDDDCQKKRARRGKRSTR